MKKYFNIVFIFIYKMLIMQYLCFNFFCNFFLNGFVNFVASCYPKIEKVTGTELNTDVRAFFINNLHK